jgi:hypothetical protein
MGLPLMLPNEGLAFETARWLLSAKAVADPDMFSRHLDPELLDVCNLTADSNLLDRPTGSYEFPFHRICSCGGRYCTSLVSVLVWTGR